MKVLGAPPGRTLFSYWLAIVVIGCAPLGVAAQLADSPETVLQGIDPGMGVNALLDAGNNENASTETFTGLASKVRVDPQFGSATSSIAIAMPRGRKEMTPDITVRYSSNLGNGIFGVGWDLELGCIERNTNHGVPLSYASGSFAYSDDYGFAMVFRGGTIELDTALGVVGGCASAWGASSEEVWLSACFDAAGNKWTVTDSRGMTYTYGEAQGAGGGDSRTGKDVSTAAGTFSWQLTSVEDLSGNTISHEYWKDGGYSYPRFVHYGGNASAGLSQRDQDTHVPPMATTRSGRTLARRPPLKRRSLWLESGSAPSAVGTAERKVELTVGRAVAVAQAQLRNTRAAQRVPLAWSRSVRAQCSSMRCTQPIIEKKRCR